ncbi:MAG: GHMP kinase [Bacteroidales bacterium]|nr:GHMP kinase [Bacteroidales bacterium]
MIITKTPFRISFAGGGSDIRTYYRHNGGAVLSTSINKYMYLSIHPYFFRDGYFLKYSKTEKVDSVEDIQHKIIKQIFKMYNIKGVDFNSSADIPAQTGLASSSAFTVGMITLCNAYVEKYMSKEETANLACTIEIEKLHEPIGKQDQYACACGGLNYIEFNPDESVYVEKLYLNHKRYEQLQKNLLLFYTGYNRSASEILSAQTENILRSKNKFHNLNKMVKLAKELKIELLNNNIEAMGEILNTGWNYKKELAGEISNGFIDENYKTALKNGATGGKLLGAGGGGFLLFYAEEQNHDKLKKALKNLKEVPFMFDNSGTATIHYDRG